MVARPHAETRESSGDGDARATLPRPRAVLGERLGEGEQPGHDAGDRRAAHDSGPFHVGSSANGQSGAGGEGRGHGAAAARVRASRSRRVSAAALRSSTRARSAPARSRKAERSPRGRSDGRTAGGVRYTFTATPARSARGQGTEAPRRARYRRAPRCARTPHERPRKRHRPRARGLAPPRPELHHAPRTPLAAR